MSIPGHLHPAFFPGFRADQSGLIVKPPILGGRFLGVVTRFLRFPINPSRLARVVPVICAGLLAGCCTPKPAPPAPKTPSTVGTPVAVAAADYPIVFPDVVELKVAGRPDCPALVLVNTDGRIDLGPYGEVFAEGATAEELSRRVALATDVPTPQVRCQVAVARSRVVNLLGPGASQPRALAYAGPERVADVLRRVGPPPGTDAGVIRVVRRNVARGVASETFTVDLGAIRKGDDRTNVLLEPNDEIHVGEDRGVVLAGFVPDWAKP